MEPAYGNIMATLDQTYNLGPWLQLSQDRHKYQNMSIDSDVMLQYPKADTLLLVISRLLIISNTVQIVVIFLQIAKRQY